MTEHDPNLEDCGCTTEQLREGHRLGCMLRSDSHRTEVAMGRAGQPNFTVTCTCGARMNVAAVSRASADRVAAEHVRDEPTRLRRRLDDDRAYEELCYVASVQEAVDYLAGYFGAGPGTVTAATYAEAGEVYERAAQALLQEQEAIGWDRHRTDGHLRYALAIAGREVHPPAADPAEYEAEVMVMVTVRWRGEGNAPAGATVADELATLVPSFMRQLADEDPESWALVKLEAVELGDQAAEEEPAPAG